MHPMHAFWPTELHPVKLRHYTLFFVAFQVDFFVLKYSLFSIIDMRNLERHNIFDYRTGSTAKPETTGDKSLEFGKKQLYRLQDMQKEEHVLNYGRLEPEHPVQQYVDNLVATRLPYLPITEPIKISILPGWTEANALCWPDGTIMIGSGLLKRVKTEEGLLGVIAHEIVHAVRQHAEAGVEEEIRIEGIRDTSNLEYYKQKELSTLMTGRVQESEADLRSVIELLEKNGINPDGIKSFYEDLNGSTSKTGSNRRPSVIHGDFSDRAINIKTLYKLLDLSSLSGQPLRNIPNEILSEMQQAILSCDCLNRGLRSVNTRIAERKWLDKAQEVRRKYSTTLKVDQIPAVLKRLWREQAEAREKGDLGHGEFMETLVKRFRKELPDSSSGDELYTLLALDLLCNIPAVPQGLSPLLKGLEEEQKKRGLLRFVEEFEQRVKTKEDVDALRIKVESFLKLDPGKFISTQIIYFWGRLAKYVLEKKIYNDHEYTSFVDSWSPMIAELANHLGTGFKKINPKETRTIALSFYRDTEIKQYHSRYSVYGENFQKDSLVSKRSELKLIEDLSIKLGPEIADLPLVDLIKIVKIVVGTAQEKESERVSKRGGFSPFEWDNDNDGGMAFYHILYQLLLPYNKEYNQMPEAEKKAFTHFLFFVDRVPKLIESKKEEIEKSETLEPTIQSYVDHLEKSFDQNVQYINIDYETLSYLTKYLLDRKFIDTRAGHTIYNESDLEAEWVWVFNNYVRGFDLNDIFRTIEQIKSEHKIDVENLCARHAKSNVTLIRQIKELCQKDNPAEFQQLGLEKLFWLTSCVSDPFIAQSLREYVLGQFWDTLSFEEKLCLVFPIKESETAVGSRYTERFLEEDIKTEQDFAAVKKRANQELAKFVREGTVEGGAAVLFDLITFEYFSSVEFIMFMLSSSRGDGPLKDLIFNEISSRTLGIVGVKDTLRTCDGFLRVLYNGDEKTRSYLLRKVLIGRGGLLRSAHNKSKFFSEYFQTLQTSEAEGGVVSEWELQASKFLSTLAPILASIDDTDLLYFVLHGVLVKNIGNPPPPSKLTYWGDVYSVREAVDKYDIKTHSKFDRSTDRRTRRDALRYYQEKIDRALAVYLPKSADEEPWVKNSGYFEHQEKEVFNWLKKKKLARETGQTEITTPLKFIKQVGERCGSLAVRFLQQLPLIIEIPKEQSKEFSEIYDRTQGQLKISALNLLEREWPDFWKEIDSVGDRIGGGSIVTVYECMSKNGEAEVLRVRNPNIFYQLEEYYRFATQVVDELEKRDGGEKYRGIKLILSEVKRWIELDASFTNFLADDQKFREQHQGFKTSTSSKYSIYIPESRGPESEYFSREEKVVGTNLTRWDKLVEVGHDLKEVVHCLASFYISQINLGQALSDVHPGNVAVTEDSRLVIYDRNLYLHLDETDRELISMLFMPMEDMEEKKAQMLKYLMPKDHAELTASNLETAVEHFLAAISGQDSFTAQKALVDIKEAGAVVPLKFTLLLKNIHVLNQMAVKAGFSNLLEAVLYEK